MTDETPPEPAPRRRLRLPVVSVRVRLVVAITITALLGLVAVGASVYVVERARILAQIDERLAANLETARYIAAEGKGNDEAWKSSAGALGAIIARMSPDDNTGALGLWDGEAHLEPGVPLDVDLLAEAPGFVDHVVGLMDSGNAIVGATYAEEGVLWQYLAAPVEIPGSVAPETVYYVLAYDVDAELGEIDEAARAYIVVSAVVIAAVALIAWVVAGRLLRPLRLMRRTAERVSAQSLDERLPIEGRDDVSELAGTMNDMLDRLDRALGSQKQLLSDVRHELRTPITIVRGHLELMDPQDPADVRETQSLAMDELDRMNALVQNLSEAASLHGPSPIQPQQTDVGDLLEQIIRKASALEGADVKAGPTVQLVAELDPARITQAVLQLVQNGVTHGGGRLVIGSNLAGAALEIWVRDYGPGVPDASKGDIFERFHRGSVDGAPREAGSGLGLNIVQMIARAHGGSARVIDATDDPGSVFIVEVPLNAATAVEALVYEPVDDQPARVDPIRPAASPLTPTGLPGTLAIPPRPPLPGPDGRVASPGDDEPNTAPKE